METINGIYTSAYIHCDSNNFVEEYARAQVKQICDQKASKDSVIHLMPDIHPAKVCPIGLTMTVGDAIIPTLVGVDIGCGVTIAQIKNPRHIEGKQIDAIIREGIPSGFDIRQTAHRFALNFDLSKLYCIKHIDIDKALCSIGTLGGGNHFIEIDKDEDRNTYVTVHSGSRHLGQEVSNYYTLLGHKKLLEQKDDTPYELTFLIGDTKRKYLHDIEIVQQFAAINRQAIIDVILKGIKAKSIDTYSCAHNYVTTKNGVAILRKGAISAFEGERVIIPINMKDGIILGVGKGNPNWNYSAPHGSGRVMNRTQLKACTTVSAFKKEMKGIYSSCINDTTLDESPFAYRRIDAIKNAIEPTVSVTKVITPIYNFKAGGEQ